ncbi:hypothetical protein BABINDRAFT_144518 [Babjeviella inositovora NRRL Y-12698]|uniref:Uncharacterized protein n=1 Tax=Babjeviella inositovora NRRL Y-12698 TaxID=984486 RepID=A0A1E3QPB4_9ASCO|nr:uncharacterized protein BABINDRAFT_144518 [Babjeviella inositovora NRRL Y-12698]ODQ79549.1 hypothetical protein BABINDRAFT_144518 [Babjeviella inositovora NRRL Y-12698]
MVKRKERNKTYIRRVTPPVPNFFFYCSSLSKFPFFDFSITFPFAYNEVLHRLRRRLVGPCFFRLC